MKPSPSQNALFDLLNGLASTEDEFFAAHRRGDTQAMAAATERKKKLDAQGLKAVHAMLAEHPELQPQGYDSSEDTDGER